MCVLDMEEYAICMVFYISTSIYINSIRKWCLCIHEHELLICFLFFAGQFWNTPINVTMYTGDRGYIDPNDRAYYLSITSSSSVTRTFVGVLQERTWDKTRTPCIYAGNRQAGPIGDIPEDEVPNDSVIEGTYEDYIVSTPFGNDCSFCNLFDATRCSSSG